MQIDTGRGTTIPLITLIGIFSISALNALPGLAVSPILGDLNKVFPGVSDLEIQTLTSLPSLLIIPFILLSGKLTERVNNLLLLKIGLFIFTFSGILYLLSDKMWQLIAVSALLGVGSGMIVPLSTGLISKFFAGDARTKQYGLSSAITNITLVVATTITGYLADVNWKLPFVVYLLPIISIFLSRYLKKDDMKINSNSSSDTDKAGVESKWGIDVKRLLLYMLYYGTATYLVLVVTFNLPFIIEKYRYGSNVSGILISLFFLAIMTPGFFLKQLLKVMGSRVYAICMLAIAIGLCLIILSHSLVVIALGCILNGFSYGIIQPLIYDKTSAIAIPQKVTLALAFVMSVNYVAILICPFIISGIQSILNIKGELFGFWLNMIIAIVVWAFIGVRNRKMI